MSKLTLLLTGLALLGMSAAQAADPENGKQLHDGNCLSCHSSLFNGEPDLIYTRAERKVGSLSALQNQVQRCGINLGLKWFDTELEDVTAYLDQNFYKFGTAPQSK